ncbi:ComF family protein [Maricaulis sp.]|uniref:ComF family protein n=1 Tax=Maricaulis sp. TaxID=1486257 RepID=UPI002B271B3D|nr:ComF family protein [Maricaulis sp.]
MTDRMAGVLVSGLNRAGRRLADLAWPPVCPLAGDTVDRAGHLTPVAWSRLTFLDAPWCDTCGWPFPYPAGSGGASLAVCANCVANPPRFDRARAPLAYDERISPLVVGFKHGSRREMISQFGRWMARAGADCLDGADAIIPVPLHWRRLIARRYNQSTLLARALSRCSGVDVWTDVLLRRRATPSQAGRTARLRRRNVAAAFTVPDRSAVAGRHLVLVDDVITTGATVSACAYQLKRAGAASVRVVALCRVVRETDPTV